MRKPSFLFVVILALIILFAPLEGKNLTSESKINVPRMDIRNLSLALDTYEFENDAYPTTEQELKALLEKPTIPPIPKNWQGPYLKNEPIDPWGNQYQYRCPSQHNRPDFDIWSFGRDGKDGTEDDITNWSPTPKTYTVPDNRISDYINFIIIGVIAIVLLAFLIVLKKRRSKSPPLTSS